MTYQPEQSQRGDVEPVAPDALVDRPRLDAVGESPAQPHSFWRVVGVGGAVFLLLGAMEAGSHGALQTFLDVPSGAIVIGCTLGLLLGVFGWSGSLGALRTLLAGPSSAGESDDAVSFFRLGAGFALATGFLGTLIGLICMLKSLEDPSQTGTGIAICLLTQLYGVILAVLFCVAAGIVARRDSGPGRLRRMATGLLLVASAVSAVGVVTTVLVFAVLLISMTGFYRST